MSEGCNPGSQEEARLRGSAATARQPSPVLLSEGWLAEPKLAGEASKRRLVGRVGIEPTAIRLKVECSTTELAAPSGIVPRDLYMNVRGGWYDSTVRRHA